MVKDAAAVGVRSKAPFEAEDKKPLTHALGTCKSERPYGRDGLDDYYRELQIPKDIALSAGAEAMAWSEALCCIFTRITVWEDVPPQAYDYVRCTRHLFQTRSLSPLPWLPMQPLNGM